MEKINISTSQNISLEHSVASVGERIIAHLVDYLLFAGYFIVVMLFNAGLNFTAIAAIDVVLALPVLFYDLICELTMDGQNVGKRVMNLKVVMLDGSQPSFIAYFIRWMFRIVDNMLLLGSGSILSIIITGKGQRLGDLAAGTSVIRIAKKGSISLPFSPRIPEGYQPVFPESISLSEKDYSIIREIIDFRLEKGLSPYVIDMMEKAKAQFSLKLNITSNLDGRDFLTALERDYIYYNRIKE